MRGVRIYLATPRLRGLLALNLSFAAAGATVIVNTVVIVRGLLDRSYRCCHCARAFWRWIDGRGSPASAHP
jgi:hypothetical protein